MQNYNTPQHFALQLGSLISLYLSLSFLLVLLFGLINLKFPDATEGYYLIESASSSVRIGIAMVIVFFPTYIVLTRLVNKLRRGNSSEQYLALTKWLIYLSLLVGIGALLVDLVVVIMTFLEGEITTRFTYKALSVLVVIGAAVHYYILDARGYWMKREDKSIMFGIGATIAVVTALAFGFSHIETPAAVRDMKLDEKQVSDLQQIQWRLEEVIASSSTLPTTLEVLYGEFEVPTAPEDRAPYTYRVTETGFELCAAFAYDSRGEADIYAGKVEMTAPITNANNWQYKAGTYCFDRIIAK